MLFHIEQDLWPARRDSNPCSSESESAALSGCATGGNMRDGKAVPFFYLCFVAVRVVFLPAPGVLAHFVYAVLSGPAE